MQKKNGKEVFGLLRFSFRLILLLILLAGCAGTDPSLLTRWLEAERLFTGEKVWLGGDGAYSVGLGKGRVLWLFGDSFIDISGSGTRRKSALVRNSIAIQTGTDPEKADIRFYWDTKKGKPAAFFPGKGDTWFWPGGGICLDKGLIIFLMEIGPANNELGFEVLGSRALKILNPEDAPEKWRSKDLKLPQKTNGIIIGSASVIRRGDYIYAFGAHSGDLAAHVVRWPLERFFGDDLTEPEYWDGESWQGDVSRGKPIFSKAQMEYSVHMYEGDLIQVQTLSLIDPALIVRRSPGITGPWTPPRVIHRPEEEKGLLVYAAKAHKELDGAGLILTYAVNSARWDRLMDDMGIYFPRFLRGWD